VYTRALVKTLATVAIAVFLIAWQDSAETHLGRAYNALKLDRYDEAANEFRAALRIDPKLTMRARFPLAVALFEMKQTADSRREFETIRREVRDQPGVFYYLGRLDLLDQNFPSAIRNLTRAMEKPPFADTAYHLGFAYFRQGDLAVAEHWLNTAAQANPQDSAIYYQLGLVYRKLAREDDAKKAFARSTELRQRDSDLSRLRHDCAQSLEAGNRDEAHTVCSRLYDPNDVEKLTALGTLYGQHGDLAAALEPLRRAAEISPQSPQMQYNLAFTYFELNRFEEARAPIAKAVERWPDLFQLNSLYGAVLLKLHQPRDALPILRRAHQLNPDDARASEMFYRTTLALAQMSLESRQYADALNLFEEAARLRPDDPEPRTGITRAKSAM
jgi:tetratricopeptide (TPR) repeat protein